MTLAGELRQRLGLQIDHPVAPALPGRRFAGVQLIGVHGDQRIDRRHMLRAAVAKALGAEFNRADAKGFVGVRLKSVMRDMGVIKLHARQGRQLPETGAVAFVGELIGYAVHGSSPQRGEPPL
ncbi:hypothetical protein BN136_2044 [Cronobacter universalis NCTC 9529]|nr:hypothetical protein BN136_2044 [Cronobacter universalis NCTC 9529]